MSSTAGKPLNIVQPPLNFLHHLHTAISCPAASSAPMTPLSPGIRPLSVPPGGTCPASFLSRMSTNPGYLAPGHCSECNIPHWTTNCPPACTSGLPCSWRPGAQNGWPCNKCCDIQEEAMISDNLCTSDPTGNLFLSLLIYLLALGASHKTLRKVPDGAFDTRVPNPMHF